MNRLFVIFFLIIFSSNSFAQDAIPTRGKEFWLGFMRNNGQNPGQELKVFITSDVSTSGSLTIPQGTFAIDFDVVANQITEVLVPNDDAEAYFSETIFPKGILIETEDTVAVFAINFEPSSADGTKVLPTQSLGTDYRISSYQGDPQVAGSEFLIVATEDDTELEINLKAQSFGGQPPNVPFTITLDRGEIYQVYTEYQSGGDLTGSTIRSTNGSGSCRPFAVFSGNTCANVMPGCFACDHLFDQNFPVNTWGDTFYVVPPENFGVYTFRVMADQNNTNVSINSTQNYLLQAGQYIEFNNIAIPLCIDGDQPISVTQYFQGADCANGGDPSMLILNDENQKISDITFSTVNSLDSHGLNVICETSATNSVYLDGTLINSAEFSPFLSCPDKSYAQLSLSEGSHRLNSVTGFTAYVFGEGNAITYAYSVGSFQSNNDILDLAEETYCSNDQIELQTVSTLTDVSWIYANDTSNVIETGSQLILTPPINPGLYSALGIDQLSLCELEYVYLVEVPDAPIVNLNDLELCKNETLLLENTIDPPNGYFEYNWSPATDISENGILNPIISPAEDVTYILTVSSPTGCSPTVTESMDVDVIGGGFAGLTITATPNELCYSEEIQLSGSLNEIIIEDNFDPGISWSFWCQNDGNVSASCGSVSDNALYFSGIGERTCTSIDIDVSAGGNVSFFLKIADDVAPCDDAEVGDDIVLEYSTSGCYGDYTIIDTFLESDYPDFTQVTVPIPSGAQTTNTHFRWRQLDNDGAGTDVWMLDDVLYSTFNNSGFLINWSSQNEIEDATNFTTSSTPEQSGYYYLDITDVQSNCIISDSVYVQVNAAVEFTLPDDFSFCESTLVNLSPDVTSIGQYEYHWNSSDDFIVDFPNQNLIVQPNTSTTYTLEVIDINSQCSHQDEVSVFVNQISGIALSVDQNILCFGDSLPIELEIFGSSNNMTIDWSSTTSFITLDQYHIYSSSSESGIYTANVVDEDSGCDFEDSVEIIVSDEFSISAPLDIGTCNAITLELDVITEGLSDEDLIWNWQPQIGLSNYTTSSATIMENITQEYIITATDEYNCTKIDTFLLEIIDEELDLGPDLSLCEGDSFVLDTGYDEVINSFTWNGGQESSSIVIELPGIYSVVITSDLGCYKSDEIEVAFNEKPQIDLPEEFVACDGDEVFLSTGSVEETIEWNTGETDEDIVVSEAGCYYAVLLNEYGCTNADTTCVIFHENPTILLTDSIFECEGDIVSLLAGTATDNSYLWSTDEITPIINVNETGIYSVVVTNQFDCFSEGSVAVNFGALPVVNLPADLGLCVGDSIEISANTDADYLLWNTGDIGNSLIVHQSGAYILTGYNQYCENSDEINIVFNTYIEAILPPDTILCLGDYPDGFPLSPGYGGAIYEWNTGETTPIIHVTSPGFYRVVVKTPFGCTSTESIFISEFCQGENIFVPTAFTPDNDGINDFFLVQGQNIAKFKINIYNRNGQIVWYSNDINEPWDGSYMNGEYYGETEVYTFVIDYSYYIDKYGRRTDPQILMGEITIIR